MSDASRYICFNLGKEEFGIPLLSIKEVMGLPEITPVPQSPSHFLGIMNLRGQVISVMDLRLKMNVKSQNGPETSVMIFEVGTHSIGVVVDQVNSVQSIPKEQIADRPSVDGSKAFDYVTGVFRKDDKLVLLLDIAKVLSVEEKNLIQKQNLKTA